MKARRRISSLLIVVALSLSLLITGASTSALANACAVYPGTDAITIELGPPLDGVITPISVPETPNGLVGVCVDATGNPNPTTLLPEINPCTSDCVLASWQGVTTDPVTVTVTTYVGGQASARSFTIPGGSKGSFCIKIGSASCP